MSNEIRSDGPEYTAEDAALAHAGEAQSLPGPGEPQAMDESADQPKTPTTKQLDARERKFTGPRKPMGPTQGQVPETVPEER
ncbi:hypothetical protein OHA98_05175 [Streptomyces sp. NBC_00654]|uniref:hypothetical protein n=1 Tax=Streptomyces sp. NBC_00654 TaxID=2975799 RepID=UPI0022533CF6|nr:hypothetical protein [Streptomyces sp. NBC_00654]MCX4964216.1 hypothetical protein [Streptomyces sp. NBC_00654]